MELECFDILEILYNIYLYISTLKNPCNNLLFFVLFSTGLYLFIILIFTFVSEKRVKLSLYFIGWGLPLAVILVYVVCRASLAEPEDANTIDRYEQICGKYIHTSLAVFYNLNKFQEDFFFQNM